MREFDSSFILARIAELGDLRKVDGEFPFMGKKYTYTAYKIVPKAGSPIIRIDIKEK